MDEGECATYGRAMRSNILTIRAPGQPDSPLEEDGGAPERGRGVQQHAPSSMLFASSTVNTGSFLKEVKGSGQ